MFTIPNPNSLYSPAMALFFSPVVTKTSTSSSLAKLKVFFYECCSHKAYKVSQPIPTFEIKAILFVISIVIFIYLHKEKIH